MNFRAIATIYRSEMARWRRTIMQSIVSPVLSTSLYFIVFGAAIIAGMLISGDRIASLLGRVLRPRAAPTRIASALDQDTG